MSSLIVEVCRIGAITEHPDADALELSQIKGWQTVIRKGVFQAGDLVTYIPIDAVIPQEHSDRWEITQYLSKGRVKCARLRGEPSFGVVIKPEETSWVEGNDVAEYYGITKYEPPFRASAGDSEREHPLFQQYTDIENMRHFPDILEDGEQVSATEKIHGTNARLGIVEGVWVAGSHRLQRKRPDNSDSMAKSTYWFPYTLPGVREALEGLARTNKQVVLFGEVFGPSVQNLHYGIQEGLGFRAFDLLLNGRYMDSAEFRRTMDMFSIPVVPEIYNGAFSLTQIKALSDGHSTLDESHIREGVVVKPVAERIHPKVGRVILKYLGNSYLFAKGISDSTDV